MKKKLSLALALALSLSFCLAACGAPADTSAPPSGNTPSADNSPAADNPPSSEGSKAIAVTIPTAQSDFCNDFALGAQAGAEALGWTCTINDPNVDNAAQITAVENFVTSGVQGIVVMPVDGTGISDAAQAAMDAGVVITAYDNTMPCTYRITEDENATGRQLAQVGIDWARANTDGKIQIALIVPNEADDSRNGRILAGMTAAIEEGLPDAEIVSIQKSVDASETMTLVENIVQANPDVKLFYCQLDDIIAYEALSSLGYDRDDVCLIGASGLADAIQLIADGTVLRGTIVSDTYQTGYQAAQAMIRAIEGGASEEVGVDIASVTIDNASDYLS